MNCEKHLCAAIIRQAAMDYVWALKRILKKPNHKSGTVMKQDCERFFTSDRFGELTNLPPDALMNRCLEIAQRKGSRIR